MEGGVPGRKKVNPAIGKLYKIDTNFSELRNQGIPIEILGMNYLSIRSRYDLLLEHIEINSIRSKSKSYLEHVAGIY